VLLPAAKVHLHGRTDSLRAAFSQLQNDWRFSRVETQMNGDNLATAIALYATMQSPDLVLIETDDISETFTAKLADLADVCRAGTACIIVGPVNDVYLYRNLVGLGVSDYLVNPIAPDVMADVVANTLINRLGVSQSRLVAVMGSKGGVGASTCSRLMADLIAHAAGEKTLLLDAAGGWSYTTIAHGHEPMASLNDACRAASSTDQDNFKRLMLQASPTLSLLGTGADAMLSEPVNAASMEALVTRALAQIPYVVADLSSASGDVARAIVAQADLVVLVSTPTLPALRGARTLMNEVKTLRGNSDGAVQLIVNMMGRGGGGADISLKDIEAALGRKPGAVLPDQPKLITPMEGMGEAWRNEKGVADLQKLLTPVLSPVLKFSGESAGATKSGGGLLSSLLARK
jgi:pilus assembly protein CpaE